VLKGKNGKVLIFSVKSFNVVPGEIPDSNFSRLFIEEPQADIDDFFRVMRYIFFFLGY